MLDIFCNRQWLGISSRYFSEAYLASSSSTTPRSVSVRITRPAACSTRRKPG